MRKQTHPPSKEAAGAQARPGLRPPANCAPSHLPGFRCWLLQPSGWSWSLCFQVCLPGLWATRSPPSLGASACVLGWQALPLRVSWGEKDLLPRPLDLGASGNPKTGALVGREVFSLWVLRRERHPHCTPFPRPEVSPRWGQHPCRDSRGAACPASPRGSSRAPGCPDLRCSVRTTRLQTSQR